MSGFAVDWVWTLRRPRNGQRLVLAVLASHARGDGVCWPGEPLLERESMLGRRTIRRALRALERAGELEARPALLGRRRITVYRLAWPGRRPVDVHDYEWVLDRPFMPDPDDVAIVRPRLGLAAAPPQLELIEGEG